MRSRQRPRRQQPKPRIVVSAAPLPPVEVHVLQVSPESSERVIVTMNVPFTRDPLISDYEFLFVSEVQAVSIVTKIDETSVLIQMPAETDLSAGQPWSWNLAELGTNAWEPNTLALDSSSGSVI